MSEKKSKQVRRIGTGLPGPGRPRGSISEAHRIRSSAVKIFYKAKGEQILFDMLTSEKERTRIEALKMIFSLVPKEVRATVEQDRIQINIFRADGSLFKGVEAETIDIEKEGDSE